MGNTAYVKSGHEQEFSSLAHSSVIMLRALPRTRGLVLRRGIVNMILSCVRHFLSSKEEWPQWMSAGLLLLDVMAQPTAAPLEEDCDGEEDKTSIRKGEFARMCAERKKYETLLSKTARDIVATVNGRIVKKSRKNSKS